MSLPLASTVIHTSVPGTVVNDTYEITLDATNTYKVNQPRSFPRNSAYRFPGGDTVSSAFHTRDSALEAPQAIVDGGTLLTLLTHVQFKSAATQVANATNISLGTDTYIVKTRAKIDAQLTLSPCYVSIDAAGIAALQPAIQCPVIGIRFTRINDEFSIAIGPFDWVAAGLSVPIWYKYNVFYYSALTSGPFSDPTFALPSTTIRRGSESIFSISNDNGDKRRALTFAGVPGLFLVYINYTLDSGTHPWIGVPIIALDFTFFDYAGAIISTGNPIANLSMTLMLQQFSSYHVSICNDVDVSLVVLPPGTRSYDIFPRVTNYTGLSMDIINVHYRKLSRRAFIYPMVSLDGALPSPGIGITP